jgi:hypothetical protein
VARLEGLEAVFPEPPAFGGTSMPPGPIVEEADRLKQSQVWADILRDMGGRYAPFAKFGSLPRRDDQGRTASDNSDADEDYDDDNDDDDEDEDDDAGDDEEDTKER